MTKLDDFRVYQAHPGRSGSGLPFVFLAACSFLSDIQIYTISQNNVSFSPPDNFVTIGKNSQIKARKSEQGKVLRSHYRNMMINRTYLKNNLSARGSIAKRFKMLAYYVYAPLSHRFALCPNPNLIFEIGSSNFGYLYAVCFNAL